LVNGWGIARSPTTPWWVSDNGTGKATIYNGNTGVPAAPSNLMAAVASSTQINLNWQDNSNDETGFQIFQSSDGGISFSQIAQVGANVQSYSDTNGLAPNTKYYYRVRATNGTIDSDYSNAPSAVTFR